MEEKKTGLALLKEEMPQLTAILSLNARTGTDVQTMAAQELEFLRDHLMTKPAIGECLPQTIVMAVKGVLRQNLTLDPQAGLVYVKTRSIKVGNAYQKALEIQPTANGLISINRQCGRILDIKRPTVKKNEAGQIIGVDLEILLPSHNGTRWETRSFDEDDFYRWQRASHNENGRNKQDADASKMNYSNPNYTNFKGGIDPEFARAKAIRHGLKKLGTNPNERVMQQITIEDQKTVYVDPKVDEQAFNDEIGITENEDVTNQTTETQATYHVTTHEEINIPNANEL
jgi:recombinational DNA repair protein RecT